MLVRIAVHLDQDQGCEHRLHAAAQLAADHEAELVGVYASYFPLSFYDEVGTPDQVYSLLRARFSEERLKFGRYSKTLRNPLELPLTGEPRKARSIKYWRHMRAIVI